MGTALTLANFGTNQMDLAEILLSFPNHWGSADYCHSLLLASWTTH